MSARFLVTLPTRDERGWAHLPPYEERAQAVQAAEVAAIDGVVAPYDLEGEESTVVVSDALRHSRWLHGVLEFHVSDLNPVYAAKIAASSQRFHGGRLAWAPLVEAPTTSQRLPASTGLDAWYARADEFLTVARGVWENAGYDHDGTYYQVRGGGFPQVRAHGFRDALAGLPFPRVHLTGTSDHTLGLSARHGDVHLFTSPREREEHGPRLDALADAAGRTVAHGLRLSLLAREDDAEARAVVAALEGAGPDLVPLASGASWWDGFARLGHAVPGGLVGSYADVAAELRALTAPADGTTGVDTVVVDLRPRVEETYRLGEHVLPLVRTPSATTTPLETTGAL
ncbi:LLM class flavin-dependent oxidoreductase [Mumia sp. DW29H23]|uniref:LLM class flavin-dependent oxidoreductase n=1 Tax=Mumia sp. DW29H23 TaxID=3421241 RepID=UPI003D68887C